MYKNVFQIVLVFVSLFVKSQSFEVDQIEQMFRPRLKVDSKYIFDSKFKDTSGTFNQKDVNMVFTFPLKSKFDADVKLDLQNLKLKDILKNSIRIKAVQTLGMIRVNGKQVNFGFDTLPQKNIYNVTGGILGLKLTKKFRVLFYSLNTTLAEQDKTLNKPGIRASALLGQLHLRGLRKNYFYGLAVLYSDGLILPAPFFGGSEPLGKNFIFNYTLPVQINLQYKNNRKSQLTIGVTADGYRSGINFHTKRVNVNYTSAFVYTNFKFKFSRTLIGRMEGGYVFYQNLTYTKTEKFRTGFLIAPGPYLQIGMSVLFGKTLWEKVIDGILN